MQTHLAVNDRLLDEARRLGRHKSKRDAVAAALKEYIANRRHLAGVTVWNLSAHEGAYHPRPSRAYKR